jgi:predicted Rossmann fold flavoprotein
VIRALERALRDASVDIYYHSSVSNLIINSNALCGVALNDGREVYAGRVILATGGASYPATGSTGDGWRLAEGAGHTIMRPLPALTPIETAEEWPRSLSGLTLKNVTLSVNINRKRLASEPGELLFTHFGISGPLALTLSSFLPVNPENTKLFIDLKPALDDKTLDDRLIRDIGAMPRKKLISVMDGLAPHSLASALISITGLDPDMRACDITAAQRQSMRETLKSIPLTVKALRGFDEAIITRGGVAVSEINPSTLESKKLPGLYFAGEMIDVDALTGGYNLQIAFSTGALAGGSAAI